jgi:hypothetical protein
MSPSLTSSPHASPQINLNYHTAVLFRLLSILLIIAHWEACGFWYERNRIPPFTLSFYCDSTAALFALLNFCFSFTDIRYEFY